MTNFVSEKTDISVVFFPVLSPKNCMIRCDFTQLFITMETE